MEKDIGRIKKNDTTEIVVRIDDFGGKRGLTIREFVTSPSKPGGYTGPTKSGTRIPVDKFLEFREAINSVDINELKQAPDAEPSSGGGKTAGKKPQKTFNEEMPDY